MTPSVTAASMHFGIVPQHLTRFSQDVDELNIVAHLLGQSELAQFLRLEPSSSKISPGEVGARCVGIIVFTREA